MKIASVRMAGYSVPLPRPWPSAEGPVTRREGAILVLAEDDGATGLGETAPFPGFGVETVFSSLAALRLAAKYLVGLPRARYAEAIENLPSLAPVAAAPCARHAIDLALHNLLAGIQGVPLARLLGGEAALPQVPVNAVIPRVSPRDTIAEAERAVLAGYRTLKIKVGGASLEEDLERVRAARRAVGARVRIRLDVNQAWTEREAIDALRALASESIEYCEQPVRAGAVSSLARVRRAAGVRIAADEAIHDEASATRVLEAGAADVIVVKPMVLGGLRPARAVADLAREHGAVVVVTSLLEGAVGRHGALHFAASLGPARHAHGVATGIPLGNGAREAVSEAAVRGGTMPVTRPAFDPAFWQWLERAQQPVGSLEEDLE